MGAPTKPIPWPKGLPFPKNNDLSSDRSKNIFDIIFGRGASGVPRKPAPLKMKNTTK